MHHLLVYSLIFIKASIINHFILVPFMATPAQIYGAIDNAARLVESQIYRDNSFPDLRDLLGTQSHVSSDYSATRTPILKKEAVIPLPPSLVQLYSQSMYKLFFSLIN